MRTAQTIRKQAAHTIRPKKGQAALEFLTTYGWAFLIVLVMIGALSYFGVLDPSRLLPDKCIFGSGIGCTDYAGQISTKSVRAQLVNGFGYTITIENVKVDITGVTTPGTAYQCCNAALCDGTTAPDNDFCNLAASSLDWKADEQREFVVAFNTLQGSDKPRVGVEIQYHKGGSSYAKNISGVIQVRPN